jgi:type II restriction/modification system DNA methylase subunit YeeA
VGNMPLDLTSFAVKWQQTQLTEKSAYQQHFRDLCEALGVPHPTEEDIVGTNYTFEKHVTKVGGGSGFADVWKRDAFAWEYKLPGGDLNKAYRQLNEYHEDLENPPLLIVCDFKRFEVHTKFDSQRSRVYAFDLEELRKNQPVPTSALLPQDVLRNVFGDRNLLRPEAVTERVTRDAATDLLKLAQQLELERAAAPDPHTKEQIAHFLIRIVFCLFADSIGLIPNNVFRKLVEASRQSRVLFNTQLPQLFEAMSTDGKFFGADIIPWFNGGLFNGSETLELNTADCDILRRAAKHDWSQIEPSIFGTLFERSLDAAKRSMIGAHYTSPEDILLLIEPVVMTPLRRDWAAAQQAIDEALAMERAENINGLEGAGLQPRHSNPPAPGALAPEGTSANKQQLRPIALRANRTATKLLQDWAASLQKVRILDPACGSGNFLYIAMKQLLDLWEEARTFGLKRALLLPVESMPTPAQLYGIELDFYAHEIASAVVWIGLLQWKRDHSYNDQPKPILEKLSNIEHNDAIMRYDESSKSEEFPNGKPYEPDWPKAEYIVGNPPFLGGQDMKGELPESYVDSLRALYANNVPGSADLVLYWFEKARRLVLHGITERVGFIGTQSIRGGANRRVLQSVVDTANIFFAISDKKWPKPNGPSGTKKAMVQVSLVGFDNGFELEKMLDGVVVKHIPANLRLGLDTTKRKRLKENAGLAHQGPVKVGKFEISQSAASELVRLPNPHGRSNSEVLSPWMNGNDIKFRPKNRYIINFGDMSREDAALFEQPFEYIKKHVYPKRQQNKSKSRKDNWWKHGASGSKLLRAKALLERFIVTTRHSKHRIFLWVSSDLLPDSALVAITRSDDYFFGVLHSRLHDVWARSQGTQLRDVKSGFRYTPNSTFDTFPFPYPPSTEPSEAESPIVRAIAYAARELVRLRDNWLNPPGASEEDLKTRTLTNLYTARHEWLANAHRALDQAVFAAYGWPTNLTDQEILARLLALNHERAAGQSKSIISSTDKAAGHKPGGLRKTKPKTVSAP